MVGDLFKRCLFAALAAWLWSAAVAQAQTPMEQPPSDPNVIRWDPAIRHGVLPNGLRYAVMHNVTPSGGVSIRLAVAVGSLDEGDDERGAAHFLEHMAFGGSHAQLQADVEQTFAAAGVAFGRDRNARTDYRSTVFQIDLPHGDDAALDLGFHWLRAVASGAKLTDNEVDLERGVILSERSARMSQEQSLTDAVTEFQAPGSLFAARAPIGALDTLEALTAQKLQAFYDRWYQPANAFVVVVGDESVDSLEARVRSAFGDWASKGPLPTRASTDAVDEGRGVDVFTQAAANLPTEVSACRLRNPAKDAPLDMAALRRRTLTEIWSDILDARLAQAIKSPSVSLISAHVVVRANPREPASTCLLATPGAGGWPSGLAVLQDQVRRLNEGGVSEDELEAAIRRIRATLRGGFAERATRKSDAIANAIVKALLDGKVEPSPAEAFRAFDVAVEDATPADVLASFHQDWSGAGPLIAVVASEPPTAEAVRTAWASGQQAKLAAGDAAAPALAPWPYVDFGKNGRVIKREVFQDPAFVRLTFANGLRVNFKQTDLEKAQVSVYIHYGAGRREVASADYLAATMGAGLFPQGGLARYSYADLNRRFSEYAWKFDLHVGDTHFLLRTHTDPGGLGLELQMLAAYFTDPGFRDLDPILPTLLESSARYARASPAFALAEALRNTVAPGNPQAMPPPAVLQELKAADFARVLKPALSDAPLELTVVGDIDEADLIAAVTPTFGALPPRKATPRERSDTWFLRFPTPTPEEIRAFHEGPPEQAMVGLVWPLYVAEPARRREEYALRLVSLLYQDALLRRIRGDLGKTYSPAAATRMPDFADQGMLLAEVDTAPSDIDLVRREMLASAQRIAAGAFSDADLETIRKPFLERLAKQAETNDWWANGLEGSSVDRTALDDLIKMQSLTASITSAEVRKAAADWLSRAPIVVICVAKPRDGDKP